MVARKRGSRELRRTTIWFGGAIFATLFLWWLWPKDLESHSSDLFHAVLAGDTDKVFSFSAEHEKTETGLTLTSFKTLWTQLIAPRLGSMEVIGRIVSTTYPPGHQSITSGRVRARGGIEFELTASCTVGDVHPESNVLSLLLLAWKVDYARETGASVDTFSGFAPYIVGLERDRAMLDKLGITGIAGPSPKRIRASWDNHLIRWRQFKS